MTIQLVMFSGERKWDRYISLRLNIQAFPEICNMPENALIQYLSNEPASPQVDSKSNSVINLLMVMCQKSPPLLFEAFPRSNYQPNVWQKWWGYTRQHQLHLPRPSLCGGRFLASFITIVRKTTTSAPLKGAYRLPLSCRLRPEFCCLDCILLL